MSELGECAVILFAIVKACMGVGMLKYPQMFHLYGVAPVIFMTFISGIASVIGAIAYVNLNAKFRKSNSISTLSSVIISPRFKYFVDFVIISKCIAVGAVYLSYAKKLINSIPVSTGIQFIDEDKTVRGFLFTLFGSLALIPSILGPSLINLKSFTYLGTFTIFSLIVISKIQTAGMETSYKLFTDNFNVFSNVGTFVFGFTCHQSVLGIHNDSRISDKLLKIIIVAAFSIVGLIYLIFGYINYSAFTLRVSDMEDGISKWNDNYLTNTALFFFAISLVISVPFQLHPAKVYFGDLFGFKSLGRSITTYAMISICFSLSFAGWYNIDIVAKTITKPMNTLLCFGFPLIYTLFTSGKKTIFDWINCTLLLIFIGICIGSYFI